MSQEIKVKKGNIVNTVTGDSIEFQHNPNTLETSKDGNWEDTDNRNTHPHQDFKGGGNHKINFPLRFINKGPGYDTSGAVVWLRTLTDPILVNGKYTDPPTCLVTIGGGVWKVKVRKVTVTYVSWFPTGQPKIMDVALECVEWKAVPKPPEKDKTPKAKTPSKSEQKAQEKPYAYLLNQ